MDKSKIELLKLELKYKDLEIKICNKHINNLNLMIEGLLK